jgi:ABC-2 type transport system permease protein
MRGTWIVFQREIRQYFFSPIAYLIAVAFLLLTALMFNSDLAFSVNVRGVNPSLIPDFLTFALIFFAPLLTMRMLAEETREGTLELLLTAPVRDSQIVFGKFLSAWFYYTLLLLATWTYQLILTSFTVPDFAHTICAYIGIWLYGGATLAVGILFSSLTENQIVAAFLSTAVLLGLWLADLAGEVVASIDLAQLLRKMSIQAHFAPSFAYGLVRAEDVAYFAGIIVICLFVTIRLVESRRWR